MPTGIYKRTEEIKQRISNSLKGNTPWNKCKKTGFMSKNPDETRRKDLINKRIEEKLNR